MSIYLDKDSYAKLQQKKVGEGSDGAVYKYSHDKLIKIYHNKINNILSFKDNDDDIKIYNKESNTHKNIVVDSNDNIETKYEKLKIYTISPIKKAIKRQQNIKLSNLPLDLVFYDNMFVGCLLKKAYGIGIHKLMGMPLKYKLQIMNNVIDVVKELMDNYIYPRDIANSPFSVNRNGVFGHSHILVNPLTKNVSLIDLEGQSTIYTDRPNNDLISETESMLNELFIEFVFAIENYYNLETDELIDYVKKATNFDNDLLDKLISLELTMEGMKELTKVL